MLKSIYQRVGVSLLAAALTAGAAYAQEKRKLISGLFPLNRHKT